MEAFSSFDAVVEKVLSATLGNVFEEDSSRFEEIPCFVDADDDDSECFDKLNAGFAGDHSGLEGIFQASLDDSIDNAGLEEDRGVVQALDCDVARLGCDVQTDCSFIGIIGLTGSEIFLPESTNFGREEEKFGFGCMGQITNLGGQYDGYTIKLETIFDFFHTILNRP